MFHEHKEYLSESERREKYRANTPIEDLLLKQSRGQFLTLGEKLAISRYQESKRKQRKN